MRYQLRYIRKRNQARFLGFTTEVDIRVRDTGIEPVTSSVSGKRATAAPIAPCTCLYRQHKLRWRRDSNPCIRLCRPLPRLSAIPPWRTASGTLTVNRKRTRADDETRTRDPHLGKVMRYQLRYIRKRNQARFLGFTTEVDIRVRDTGIEPVTPTMSR